MNTREGAAFTHTGLLIADDWSDYALLDTGDGEKLERWNEVIVIRPDPQIIWPRAREDALWQQAHMRYHRSRSGGGYWETLRPAPPKWELSYGALRFLIKPTDFKHMGLFPEQAVNWQWAAERIHASGRPIRALNLFGYTGGATVACLCAGAEVTHVDAAKGMNEWAKTNIALSGLGGAKHRVITDDVMKFLLREARRGSRYDVIVMDPPSFGRGPSGELWKLEDRLFELVAACTAVLTDQPLFMLLNAYTAGFSPAVAANILALATGRLATKNHTQGYPVDACYGRVSCGEVGLQAAARGIVLPCGLFARWEAI